MGNKYLFEVGGANKTFEQIKDVPDSFLAIDNTETGYKNRIPLWLFGFLYSPPYFGRHVCGDRFLFLFDFFLTNWD